MERQDFYVLEKKFYKGVYGWVVYLLLEVVGSRKDEIELLANDFKEYYACILYEDKIGFAFKSEFAAKMFVERLETLLNYKVDDATLNAKSVEFSTKKTESSENTILNNIDDKDGENINNMEANNDKDDAAIDEKVDADNSEHQNETSFATPNEIDKISENTKHTNNTFNIEDEKIEDCIGKCVQMFDKYTSIDYLLNIKFISVRTYNCLKLNGCVFISDIVRFNTWKDLQLTNGVKTIAEIRFVLERTYLAKNSHKGTEYNIENKTNDAEDTDKSVISGYKEAVNDKKDNDKNNIKSEKHTDNTHINENVEQVGFANIEEERLVNCLEKYPALFSEHTTVDYLLSNGVFSTRTYKSLKQNNCKIILDILLLFNNWSELKLLRGVGDRTIKEIRFVLERTKLFEKISGTFSDNLMGYFTNTYKFLNYEEIKFVAEYYNRNNIEPFLYILYKYLIQSSERDITIYCQYYGLYDGEPIILEELADKVDLSRERVRQIVFSSLKIDENFLNKVSSDQIFKCIYLDELSNEYIHYKEEQNIPFGFTQFAALLTLVGTFKEQDIMGYTCLINSKMTFGFDCKAFVKKCSRMSQSRRNTIHVPIISLMEGFKDKRCVELAKGIASRYLGIQSTAKNELIFKQTYIDYENEVYWILFNNAEPMLLNDIMALLSERHPDYKLKDNPRVREEMYSRGRITSIPIEGESYKLYMADKSKAGLSLDRWWEEGQYCDYNDEEEDEENIDE